MPVYNDLQRLIIQVSLNGTADLNVPADVAGGGQRGFTSRAADRPAI
jgi:hypothetical protein